MATLLEAGLTLDEALSFAATHLGGSGVGRAIRDVRERVRAGSTLATALARHPKIFDEFYRGVITAGERSGRLGESVSRLAEYLERQADLRSRVLNALAYPAIMVVVGSAAILMLLLFVIPRFATILGANGGELPWSAQALVTLSGFVGRWWWLAALATAGAVAAVVLHRATPRGRLRQDLWLLSMPLVGGLRSRLVTERVARALAGALAGGVHLMEALEIAGEAACDAAFCRELKLCAEGVRRGESLSAHWERGGVFPPLATQMLSAGETSGRLVPMLEHVAKVYGSETERHLRTLVALVEPLVIVLLGGAVAFVAIALLQTIYGIGTL
jgi:general secretion pathway protein F